MGGSITEMNGYRPMVAKWLEERFPKTKFECVHAGISSTCSTTGAFRLQRDVLSHGSIDLFFIEFAVNDDQDAGHSKEACIRGMEGIIRQMRLKSPKTDLVVTYFVNPGMLEQLKQGKTPLPMAAHERVLEKYGVSRIHLARELAGQIKQGSFSWEKFGGTHPKKPGNRLCADMHIEMLGKAWSVKNGVALKKKKFPLKPIDPNSYFNGRFLSPSKSPNCRMEIFEPEWKAFRRKTGKILGRPLLHGKPDKPIRLKLRDRPSESSSKRRSGRRNLGICNRRQTQRKRRSLPLQQGAPLSPIRNVRPRPALRPSRNRVASNPGIEPQSHSRILHQLIIHPNPTSSS